MWRIVQFASRVKQLLDVYLVFGYLWFEREDLRYARRG